jgi:hypothetical protein
MQFGPSSSCQRHGLTRLRRDFAASRSTLIGRETMPVSQLDRGVDERSVILELGPFPSRHAGRNCLTAMGSHFLFANHSHLQYKDLAVRRVSP